MILFASVFAIVFLSGVFFGLLLAHEYTVWRRANAVGDLDFTLRRVE